MPNKDQPLVSIVLPTYNGARYLEDSIQSCIDQTYKNWELIIVDDHSNDETPIIIENFRKKDSRIRFMQHSENRKLPAALNTGFSVAKGDLLTWTSDDNNYKSDALSEMVNYLIDNPDIGFVYCNFTKFSDNGSILQDYIVQPPENLCLRNCIGPCFLYKKEIALKTGNFSDDLFLAEDYDYWLRISQLCRIGRLQKNLYLYRLHEGSLTEKKRSQVITATIKTLSINLPRLSWVPDDYRAKGHINLARMTNFKEAPLFVLSNYCKAVQISPIHCTSIVLKRILNIINRLFFKIIK